MELALKDGLDITLGDTLYYINTGTSKSHGDLKTTWENKMTNKQLEKWYSANGFENHPPEAKRTINLNCKLIAPEVVEKDFEMVKELEMLKKALVTLDKNDQESIVTMEERIEQISSELYTDEYNVARYLDAFNKKVKPLLVCFNMDVRTNILLDIIKIKDKQTKKVTEKLKERVIFTKSECELVSGISNKAGDQDSYEELMRMEDKEIRFWDRVNKLPNNMEVEEWESLRVDYHERMRIAKEEGIKFEKSSLEDVFKHLELTEMQDAITLNKLPMDIFIMCDIRNDKLVSRKWNEPLCDAMDIFKYRKAAMERDNFYKLSNIESLNHEDRYEQWLDYLGERKVLTGETETQSFVDINAFENSDVVEKLQEAAANVVIEEKVEVKKKRVLSEGEEDEDELEMEEDEDGNLTRSDEVLLLDDEHDDTFGEVPDGYYEEIKEDEPKEEDEWGF
jgi:hypothetical protein